jgi:hypothetical protein
LEQAFGKTGQKPSFSVKSKEAVPKSEVLEQLRLTCRESGGTLKYA